MEEHVASGILTANSHWRDYCMKVLLCFPLVMDVQKSFSWFLIELSHDFRLKMLLHI